MGLFGFGNSSEGPGVSKNSPEKNGFFKFFELFKRKIGKLAKLNMLYFLVSIPFIFVIFLISLKVINVTDVVHSLGKSITMKQASGIDSILRFSLLALVFIFWGSGPFSAGFVYILRNFAWEEHAWLVSDFFAKTKENLKNGFIILFFDLIIFTGSAIGFHFYSMQSATSLIWLMPQTFLIILLLIYTMMHTYIYEIMVTFDLPLSQIIKNAFIMTIAKFPMNLLLALIILLLTGVLLYFTNALWLILVPFIYVSFCGFILHFYASNMIKRNFIDSNGSGSGIESIFEEK